MKTAGKHISLYVAAFALLYPLAFVTVEALTPPLRYFIAAHTKSPIGFGVYVFAHYAPVIASFCLLPVTRRWRWPAVIALGAAYAACFFPVYLILHLWVPCYFGISCDLP